MAPHHYCCLNVYLPSTGQVRVSDTISILPHPSNPTSLIPRNILLDADTSVQESITTPTYTYRSQIIHTLQNLANFFHISALESPPHSSLHPNHRTAQSQRVPAATILPQRVPSTPTPPLWVQPPRAAKHNVYYSFSVTFPHTGAAMEYRHLIHSPLANTWK